MGNTDCKKECGENCSCDVAEQPTLKVKLGAKIGLIFGSAFETLKYKIKMWIFRRLFLKKKDNLYSFAEKELDLWMGNDKEEYNRWVKEAVLDLISLFSTEGHSGFSASLTTNLFYRLSRFENLTEITNNPNEWNHVGDHDGVKLYQSRRNASIFSMDAGTTYYNLKDSARIKGKTPKERIKSLKKISKKSKIVTGY